jgi:spore maturation protein CgeB
MALSKKAILEAKDIKTKEVSVPEWGGTAVVRVISGADRDVFEQALSDKKMEAFRTRFLVLTLCDENGDRLFTNDEVEALNKKSSTVLNRLFDAAWQFNAFTQDAVDSLGKDSPSDQSVSST